MKLKFVFLSVVLAFNTQSLLAGELKLSVDSGFAMDLQGNAAIVSPEFIELLRQFPYNALSTEVKRAELVNNSTLRVVAEVRWTENFVNGLVKEANVSQKIIADAAGRKVALPRAIFCVTDKSHGRPRCAETTDGYYSAVSVTVKTPLISRVSLVDANGIVIKQEDFELPSRYVPVAMFGDTSYGKRKSVEVAVDRWSEIDRLLHVEPDQFRRVAAVRVDVREALKRVNGALFQR